MKTRLYIFGIIIISFTLYNCDDSFLEQQGINFYQFPDTLFVINDAEVENLELDFQMAGDEAYTIITFPGWMEFETMEGNFSDGKTFLNFLTKNIESTGQLGTYNGIIEFNIENYGILLVPVLYANFGNPQIWISTSVLDIGERQNVSFTIKNTSNGILFWQADLLPEWLSLSENSGTTGPNESVTLTAMVLRQGMTTGTYNGSFTVYSNSPEKITTVQLTMEVTKDNLILGQENIAGEVTDAAYYKEKDLMVVCTREPNRLLLYDFRNHERQAIELDKSPRCFDFSTDGNRGVIGYNQGAVSRIDLLNYTVDKTLEVDFIPSDIVYGDNEWCYATPLSGQWTQLSNLNLETGALIKGQSNIYGETIIRRRPNTNILIGTMLNLSPNGIEIFKINPNYLVNDTVGHRHVDTGNFWFSDDGKKIYCGNGKIYLTPEYPKRDDLYVLEPQLTGLLETSHGRINWIDHNTLTNSLYAAESHYDRPPVIEEFDALNYNRKREIPVSANMMEDPYFHYLFSNREGSLLFLLKSTRQQNQVARKWFLEILSLK